MLPDLSLSLSNTASSSLRDRVLLLGALNLGGTLDQKTLMQVAEHARPRRFAAGAFLLKDCQPIEEIHLITRGHVTVTQRGRPIRVVDGMGAVGLNAVLADITSGVQAIADRDTRTLSLPAQILMDLYESNFSLVRNSLRRLTGQILEVRADLPNDEGENATVGQWRSKPRTFVEQIIEMRKSPLFATTNLDAVMALTRHAREVRGSAGDILWKAGDSADYWMRVDYGRMRCTSEDGKSATVGSDYTLGVMDAMAVQPRAFKVEALTDYIAVRIERDVLLAVLEGHFDLSRKFLANLSEMIFSGQPSSGDNT